ncbi:MAG: DMT family transporter [Candidatus Eremiobacteraeota bacterium]|nr:DMT family transporter [Candidatus Eremiobacteraeota bacterium]
MRAREWALLLILAAIWGAAFFFYKLLDEAGLGALTVSFGRVALAAPVLVAAMLAGRERLPGGWSAWGSFAVLAIFNNVVPFTAIAWSENVIPSGLAAINNAMTPIFTVVIAHYLTRDERLSPLKIAGVALGFCGVLVLIGPDALRGLGLAGVAQLVVLSAPLSYAFAIVAAKRMGPISPLGLSTGQTLAATAMLLPITFAIDRPWTHPPLSLQAWLAFLGIAILGTAVAYLLYYKILREAGAVNAVLVTFLVPIGALILGALFLHERIEPNALVGMALIFCGLAAIDGRALRSR